MEEQSSPRQLARWFLPAAIASLLFMGFGCAALVMQVTADPAKLPLDQRVLLEAEPAWVVSASAFAFVAGLIGVLLLLFRRKEAERALLVSLIGMVLWFAGTFAVPSFRDLLTTQEIARSLAGVVLTWIIFWFARHSGLRGWLH